MFKSKEIKDKNDLKKVNAGATAIEYGLIAGLIATTIVVGLNGLNKSLP